MKNDTWPVGHQLMHLIRNNSKLIQNFKCIEKIKRVKYENNFIKHEKIWNIGFECNPSFWKFDELREHN